MFSPKYLIMALIGLCFSASANAGFITLQMEWSGGVFNNSARASGFLTIDNIGLPEYYSDPLVGPDYLEGIALPSSLVSDLSLRVTGAGTGNGLFDLGDFSHLSFGAPSTYAPAPLDLTRELVGQDVGNSCGFGQPSDAGGDCGAGNRAGGFSLSGTTPNAPYFVASFTMSTGSGDFMQLTSLRAVPVPPTFALFLLGLLILRCSRSIHS